MTENKDYNQDLDSNCNLNCLDSQIKKLEYNKELHDIIQKREAELLVCLNQNYKN